jgi:hypothetical protein
MRAVCIVNSIIERKLVKYGLLARLNLIKVMIERPVTWIGTGNTASSWTYISTSVAWARRLSDSRLGKNDVMISE